MSGQMRPPMQHDVGTTWGEHRRALHRFRLTLDELVEWFAVIESLPARRADDRALRDAIQQTRSPIAALMAVLDRMEPAASWIEPADVPANESADLALVDQTFSPDEGRQARQQAEEARESGEQERDA